jgi:phosphate transport system substrate-binding protein
VRKVLALLALAPAALGCDDAPVTSGAAAASPNVKLVGVGATVPQELFRRWAEEYARVEPTTALDYQPRGSGAGRLAAIGQDKTEADFGVSDSPLSDDDVRAHPRVAHVPLAVESIAIVYALKDAPARLQISPNGLADVLMGRVAFWDQLPDNPGVKLPHTAIHVVYRQDESGSSYLLSEWLSKATTEKRWTIAPTRSLTLPTGSAAPKDTEVIARMRANDGSIGYLSFVGAVEQGFSAFAIANAAGRYVAPNLEGMRVAAAAARLGGDLRADATGSPGDLAYPLCSFTFALVPTDTRDAGRRRTLARFFWWVTHDGQRFAPPLHFGALPGELAARDEAILRTMTD